MTTPTSGLKSKAEELGLKAYMAAPPKAQELILTGVGKAQPVAQKLAPHAKNAFSAATGLWLLRRLRK